MTENKTSNKPSTGNKLAGLSDRGSAEEATVASFPNSVWERCFAAGWLHYANHAHAHQGTTYLEEFKPTVSLILS